MEQFEDIGPSVVLASPGMMQSGLSRELFEAWCTDKRNGCIIAGYCVEGTLAKVLYHVILFIFLSVTQPCWPSIGHPSRERKIWGSIPVCAVKIFVGRVILVI